MRILLLALTLALGATLPARAEDAPVKIAILVAEATTKSEGFDPKLGKKVQSAMRGFTGGRVIDELGAEVARGASVTLEILGGKRALKVTHLDTKKDAVRLRIEIEAMKFKTETTHLRGDATAIVVLDGGKETATFLAITPQL